MSYGSAVTIDGVNIWDVYGAYIYKDGYRELIQWPALKNVAGNDWQEEDGFEPDLSDPRLDSRDLTITFVCNGGAGKIVDFYHFLLTKPVMTYSFGNIGRSYDLRVTSMPSLQYAERFNIISVGFACDTPPTGSGSPSSSMREDRSYVLDGRALTDYGIRVLQGTVSASGKQADVKPLLLRNISVINGSEYDKNPILNEAAGSLPAGEYNSVGSSMEGVSGTWKQRNAVGKVTKKARDITLHCLMTDTSLSRVWQNYDALLATLSTANVGATDPTLAGAHDIIIRALGGIFQCYYKSQSVVEFYADPGKVWLKFDLTLTLFAESYSGGGGGGSGSGGGGGSGSGSGGGGGGGTQLFFLLSSEDSGFIITEDGKLIPIDLA